MEKWERRMDARLKALTRRTVLWIPRNDARRLKRIEMRIERTDSAWLTGTQDEIEIESQRVQPSVMGVTKPKPDVKPKDGQEKENKTEEAVSAKVKLPNTTCAWVQSHLTPR